MQKVLITGGNGDIAQAIAHLLKSTGKYETFTPGKDILDVTSIASVNKYMENCTPDILVNNAGYVVPNSIKNSNIESEKKAFDINLFGTFNCTAAVLKKNPKAIIINIGSSAATKVHGTWSSYCSAKAGVVMATKCWAEDGVQCICVSPGRALTKMRKSLYANEDPNTLLKPDDFAQIVFKAIKGEYPNGSHINVNVNNVKELINGKN